MSWATLRMALVDVLKGVPGIERIDAFEPEAIDYQQAYAYVLYQRGSYKQKGGVAIAKHICNVRVCVPWQSPEQAEAAIAPFVNSVPQHIRANCQLNDRLPNGVAKVVDDDDGIVAGMQRIGSVDFLALDIRVEILEKGPGSHEPGVIGEI